MYVNAFGVEVNNGDEQLNELIFSSRRVSDSTEKELDNAFKQLENINKKYSPPLWVSILKYIVSPQTINIGRNINKSALM